MKYALYDILLHTLILLGTPYFLLKMLLLRKYRTGIPERFGLIRDDKLKGLSASPTLWVHAVSVGETKAVLPLLRLFKARHPGFKIAFSTVTETGQDVAMKEGGGLIDALFYFPLDLSWVVERVLKRLKPRAFVVVEKEFWPNLFRALRSSSVPVIVVNGTISARSFRRYTRLGFLFRDVFSSISSFAARTEEDLQRAVGAGVAEGRAVLTGNIKFGLIPPPVDNTSVEALKKALSIGPSDPVIVAGSTHEGEEEMILSSFKGLIEEFPALKLVIAPRHPERFGRVEGIIRDSGLGYGRRSGSKGGAVILLDTMGELMTFYSIADAAVVGGSLVEGIGGHNLLEPASLGKPVLYGEHLTTYRYMAEMLEGAGGGVAVKDSDALTSALRRLLKDSGLRKKAGEGARKVVEENRGSLEKTLDVMEGVIR